MSYNYKPALTVLNNTLQSNGVLQWKASGCCPNALILFGFIIKGVNPAPPGAGFSVSTSATSANDGTCSGSVTLQPGIYSYGGAEFDAYVYDCAAASPAGYSNPVTISVVAGSVHATWNLIYRASGKTMSMIENVIAPLGAFAGTDNNNPQGFYGYQQNLGTMVAPSPTVTGNTTGNFSIQQALQVNTNDTLMWGVLVYSPVAINGFSTKFVHLETVGSHQLASGQWSAPFVGDPAPNGWSVKFHADNTGLMWCDVLDKNGNNVTPRLSYTLLSQYAGPIVTSASGIFGYGNGSSVNFTVYPGATIVTTTTSDVQDLAVYGQPGSSDNKPPAIPCFYTVEGSNTTVVVGGISPGVVLENSTLGSWIQYL